MGSDVGQFSWCRRRCGTGQPGRSVQRGREARLLESVGPEGQSPPPGTGRDKAPAGGGLAELWPKGRDTEAGHWVPGLPVLLGGSQGLGQSTGRAGNRRHTPDQTPLWPWGGSAPCPASDPLSSCLQRGLWVLRGGSGKCLGFFPGGLAPEPPSPCRSTGPSALSSGSVTLPRDGRAAGTGLDGLATCMREAA